MKSTSTIPALLPSGSRLIVLNVAASLKKALQLIIGLLMVNSIINPVLNLNTGNSSKLQLMLLFTWAQVILSPVSQHIINHSARICRAFNWFEDSLIHYLNITSGVLINISVYFVYLES
jgi:hypothetical protein